MKLQFYQQTLKGDQAVNQDAMAHCIDRDSAFFVVADGLGGHQGGEIISHAFCDSMLKTAPKYKDAMRTEEKSAMADWFMHATEEMNKQLITMQCSHQANTTCAILWVDPQKVITAHIGDSRVYRFNADKKLWRTRDHSVPQMLLDEGEITEQEMGVHIDQNRLTKSINRTNTHQPTIKTYPGLAKGDSFLVCTDGFWAHSKEQELVALANAKITEQNLVEQAHKVIQRANGNCDNVTWQWVSNCF